jgi:hypothetical protein
MLADADQWRVCHGGTPKPGLEQALSVLRFHKAKWALWSAAHEKGLSFTAMFSAAKDMVEHRPAFLEFLKQAWRPIVRMFMPFSFQRLMVKLIVPR